MDKQIYGQGHGRIVPDNLIAEKISLSVFERKMDEAIAPAIAQANADFEGQLICGGKVNWIRRDTIREDLFQDVQGNEEPETDVIQLCSDEAEICGQKKFKIKLSTDQLRRLQCEGLDGVYLDTVEDTIGNTLEMMWNDSHIAHLIMMASACNTGNNAMEMANLGSPDNPIVIPKDKTLAANMLESIYTDLHLVLSANNAMTNNGDIALVLPTLAANRSMPIFRDLNTCCGQDNIRVNGQLPNSILGFDAFATNRGVLSTIHNGKRIHYLIAADKKASGFVSDMYDFEWQKIMHDWFLIGTEVHGSYVVTPENIAVACVAFEQ